MIKRCVICIKKLANLKKRNRIALRREIPAFIVLQRMKDTAKYACAAQILNL